MSRKSSLIKGFESGSYGFWMRFMPKPVAVALVFVLSGCSFQLLKPQQDPFYQAVALQNPENEAAMFGLGLAAYDAGQFADSEKYFARFVHQSPSHASGWYYLASSQLEQREFKSAIKSFTRSLVLRQSNDAFVGLFYSQLYAGRESDAQAVLPKLKALGAEKYLLNRLMGELSFVQQRFPESLSFFQQSLRENPDQPSITRKIYDLELLLGEN